MREISNSENDDQLWFVLRDLKRANSLSPAWKILGESGAEIFTPMTTQLIVRNGVRNRIDRPAVPDLLFLHATRKEADRIVGGIPMLQYRYMRGGSYCLPMTVSDREMDRFIQAVHSTPVPVYYRPDEIPTAMLGNRVRIVGGPLEGVEGTLMKIKGVRKRRLLVSIPQLLSVKVEVTPDLLEIL